MQENLRLFATDTPDTLEKAWKIIQAKVESTQDDGIRIPETQTPSPFVRALINLLSKNYMSDGDIEFLNSLVNNSDVSSLREILSELSVVEEEPEDIKNWIVVMISVSSLFVFRQTFIQVRSPLSAN